MAMIINPYSIQDAMNLQLLQMEDHYRRKMQDMEDYYRCGGHRQQSPGVCNVAMGSSTFVGSSAGCDQTEKMEKEEKLKKLIAYYYGRRK